MKIKWNIEGFRKIRTSSGVHKMLQDEVDKRMSRVDSSKYAGGVDEGRSRDRGYIVTKNVEGIIDEEHNHTLERVLQ